MTKIHDLMSLQGRRALLTGAAGGIGRQMAETLAELGCDLVLVDLPDSDLASLKAALSDTTQISVEFLQCDLEDAGARSTLISRLLEEQKVLDILVNNASFVGTSGLEGWVTKFELQTVETWRRAMEVNLTAAFDLCKGLFPKLKISGHGSIINIASIYGVNGPDHSLYKGTDMGNPAAYAASKGGLIQLTRWLATTLAPDVRVNVISPGGVFRNQPEKFVSRYVKRTPLARMAKNSDFNGAIAYLASDLSEYVTGQNILVDGGWATW